jgi:hypothetical protein
MAALTSASGNAQEIIGKGLVDAISNAFGNGDIDKATTQIENMAQAVADIVAGLGTMTNWYSKLFKITSGLGLFDALAGKRNELRVKDTPYDPMSGNMPDMSPAALKNIMARQKADREAAKRQKELAALAQKQTKAVKEQTALAKAKAVLDKANAVFNLDLIQNTAALQGKLTEDETLRLKLQREILLGNSDASAKLAQELLSVQIAAMMAASVDPFGNYAKSALEAMKALQEVRNGLATLGTARIITGAEQLSIDEAAALADAINPDFAMLDARGGPINGGYSQYDRSLTATELRIFIDPSAAQYGIGVASVNNSANGNSNNYSTIQSFAGGM